MTFTDLREECCAANRRLPEHELVDLTFGNVSCLDRAAGVFAIKPSGVDFPQLTPEQIVLVDLEGRTVEGPLRPSSDTETHRRLYLAFGNARAVAHTHSRCATSFAQAGRAIPCLGTTHADYFYGEVPVTRALTAAEIGGRYEWETGNVIVERFAALNPDETPAVLVSGHGPFVWGASGMEAVDHAVALELVAEMAFRYLALNPTFTPIPTELLEKHFRRKHGPGKYYGQP